MLHGVLEETGSKNAFQGIGAGFYNTLSFAQGGHTTRRLSARHGANGGTSDNNAFDKSDGGDVGAEKNTITASSAIATRPALLGTRAITAMEELMYIRRILFLGGGNDQAP